MFITVIGKMFTICKGVWFFLLLRLPGSLFLGIYDLQLLLPNNVQFCCHTYMLLVMCFEGWGSSSQERTNQCSQYLYFLCKGHNCSHDFSFISSFLSCISNLRLEIFQDTVDESHWLHLNKSLFRVSSMINGKDDAIQEIEVIYRFFPFCLSIVDLYFKHCLFFWV